MSWKKTTIGEHCTVTSSKRFHLSDRSNSGIPFYCSKEIIQKVNNEEIDNCDYISEEFYEAVAKKYGVPQENDLLVTTRGTIGVPYLYKKSDKFYFADGNLTWMKDFHDTLFPQYLYYWFLSYEGQSKINAIAKGTAQKAVPIAGIKTLELKLPPIEIQRRIADILSVYDDLIANNQKQIKLLEEAAQRLYKEWFVDMRFPGYEHTKIVDGVPEGWDNVPLKKVVSYEIGGGWGEDVITGKSECPGFVIRGTDIDGIKRGELLSIPYRFHAQGNFASRKLQDGDIIFEVSGGSKNTGVAKTLLITKSLLEMWKDPVICASFCKLMRFDKPQIAQYIYDSLQYWRAVGETEEYEKKSASSIINYRWKDFLEQKYVLIPEQGILQKYYAISSSLYKQAVIYAITISRATLSRDHLLPRLMSMEVKC